MKPNTFRLYEPNGHLKRGIRIWGDMVTELWVNRELIVRLFKRNLTVKYKQSVLGVLWAVILPFVAIGTFVFLNASGVMRIEKTPIPYPLYALIGLTVWQLFASGLNAGCQSLVSAGDLITKINFPREILVVAAMASAVVDFFIKCVLVILLFIYFQVVPAPGALWVPILILPMVLLTVGLSLILSLVQGIVRDTAQMVTLLTTFLLFMTPVLYGVPQTNRMWFQLNPLTALVNAPRDMLVCGRICDPLAFIIASVFAVFVFLISWRVFHLVETKIPERI